MCIRRSPPPVPRCVPMRICAPLPNNSICAEMSFLLWHCLCFVDGEPWPQPLVVCQQGSKVVVLNFGFTLGSPRKPCNRYCCLVPSPRNSDLGAGLGCGQEVFSSFQVIPKCCPSQKPLVSTNTGSATLFAAVALGLK